MLLKQMVKPVSKVNKLHRAVKQASVYGGLCVAMAVGMNVQAGSVSDQESTLGFDTSDLYAFNMPDSGGSDCRPWEDCDTTDGNNGNGNGETPVGGGTLPEVSSVERAGPFRATLDKNTGPSRKGWVGRPSTLGENGLKHPVLIWGPGAGTGPSNYEFFLERMASHGFVVFCETSTNNGREMTNALDWLEDQNSNPSSPYYQKLDLDNIAAGGHSRGSVATFAIGDDRRLKTTLHIAGGSFDGDGSRSLRNPTIYIGGTEDFATSNAERDYKATTVPVFFTVLDGVDHIAATREGMPVITAWLRWHLAGEDRKGQFISSNCDFCGGKYDSEYKNW